MKCYSKPKTAIDRKIDDAFERAYREVYMNDDGRNRQIIEDAYQAAQERKTNAWKEGSK